MSVQITELELEALSSQHSIRPSLIDRLIRIGIATAVAYGFNKHR